MLILEPAGQLTLCDSGISCHWRCRIRVCWALSHAISVVAQGLNWDGGGVWIKCLLDNEYNAYSCCSPMLVRKKAADLILLIDFLAVRLKLI